MRKQNGRPGTGNGFPAFVLSWLLRQILFRYVSRCLQDAGRVHAPAAAPSGQREIDMCAPGTHHIIFAVPDIENLTLRCTCLCHIVQERFRIGFVLFGVIGADDGFEIAADRTFAEIALKMAANL